MCAGPETLGYACPLEFANRPSLLKHLEFQ